ncbi:MAG: lactate utilization protein C [Desulfobacterales bacterium]
MEKNSYESSEDQFIENLRHSLRYPLNECQRSADLFEQNRSNETINLRKRIETRSAKDQTALIKRLIEEAKTINLKVIVLKSTRSVSREICELVQEKTPEWGAEKSLVVWAHPLIEKLNLAKRLNRLNIPVYDATPSNDPRKNMTLRNRIAASFIGVTSADYCVADSATVVMKTRPGHPRSVSLLPTVHIVVIKIIKNLEELYTLLKWDTIEKEEGLTNCMTFITGPSKTADIEATLIYGAHGPREVYVYVITGESDI